MEKARIDRQLLGRFGEEQAANFLRRKGYELVGLNYRCRYGEIDIIARSGRYIVFVEVKLRKDARFAQAREFVTRSKQEKVLAAAKLWLSQNETSLQPRFDVIEVYAPNAPAGPVSIRQFEDAFA